MPMANSCDTTNIQNRIPIILDLDRLNYDTWRERFESLCIEIGVLDHIQDSNSDDKNLDDPEWNIIDSIVKRWILGTMTESLLQIFSKRIENETARQVWTNLETFFRVRLNNELQKIVIGDSSITDYCTRIKTIADCLEKLDSRVLESDLVNYTINGLSPKFNRIVKVIRSKSPMPSFLETRSMLLLEESRMSEIIGSLKHIITCPHLFTNDKDRATARNFQVLGEGYKLQRDLEKDEAYGKNAKSGVPDDKMVDHAANYGILFGGNLFEDYFGLLFVPGRMKFQTMSVKEFQKKRITKLITILKNRLQPFLNGQTEEFVNKATLEARQLSQAPYGEAILHTIGYIYTRQAARELGKDKRYTKVPYLGEWARAKRQQMKLLFTAFPGMFSLFKIQEELKRLKCPKGKEEWIMKVIEQKKNQMINYLWQINVADIEAIVSGVCQAVLKDPTISKDELKQRAIGMKKLGKILQEAKKQEGAQVQSAILHPSRVVVVLCHTIITY